MPRDAQAMIVTLFAAAHINRNGAAPNDAALEKYFELSESILLKAEARDQLREMARRGTGNVKIGPRRHIASCSACTGEHPAVASFSDSKGEFFECPETGKRVEIT